MNYFPPLCLHCTLPKSYPTRDSPFFAVSCIWMSPKQLTLVCHQLDRLWQEQCEGGGAGMPILFTWMSWLGENVLRYKLRHPYYLLGTTSLFLKL